MEDWRAREQVPDVGKYNWDFKRRIKGGVISRWSESLYV
jgi:hypothetical protein